MFESEQNLIKILKAYQNVKNHENVANDLDIINTTLELKLTAKNVHYLNINRYLNQLKAYANAGYPTAALYLAKLYSQKPVKGSDATTKNRLVNYNKYKVQKYVTLYQTAIKKMREQEISITQNKEITNVYDLYKIQKTNNNELGITKNGILETLENELKYYDFSLGSVHEKFTKKNIPLINTQTIYSYCTIINYIRLTAVFTKELEHAVKPFQTPAAAALTLNILPIVVYSAIIAIDFAVLAKNIHSGQIYDWDSFARFMKKDDRISRLFNAVFWVTVSAVALALPVASPYLMAGGLLVDLLHATVKGIYRINKICKEIRVVKERITKINEEIDELKFTNNGNPPVETKNKIEKLKLEKNILVHREKTLIKEGHIVTAETTFFSLVAATIFVGFVLSCAPPTAILGFSLMVGAFAAATTYLIASHFINKARNPDLDSVKKIKFNAKSDVANKTKVSNEKNLEGIKKTTSNKSGNHDLDKKPRKTNTYTSLLFNNTLKKIQVENIFNSNNNPKKITSFKTVLP